ncbi:hypothetical protein BCR44DRAFT_238919 [Catenaria anguillulae PL171]|uniref:Uncharacterized protein n=1 Tax=Catenaria anguillulae PL171 TaxID=765915 RepID=A0A1Y2HFI4_9FUNG|nr:hypothetical protein BCR44DRAFT_238919 [Catenaria anguillulae PL171]
MVVAVILPIGFKLHLRKREPNHSSAKVSASFIANLLGLTCWTGVLFYVRWASIPLLLCLLFLLSSLVWYVWMAQRSGRPLSDYIGHLDVMLFYFTGSISFSWALVMSRQNNGTLTGSMYRNPDNCRHWRNR